MEIEIASILKEYGLSEEEAKIYLFLVINGQLTAYKIAKEARIHRSTCYDILERLINKGFVARNEKNKKMIFSANELDKVISGLKERESLLVGLIPKIKGLEREETTKIRHLETLSSQKEFNINILELAKKNKISFFYCLSNGPSEANYEINSLNMLLERLIKEAEKNKLFRGKDYRGIWDFRFKGGKFIKIFNKLGENRFLALPTQATTIIFDNYVVFLYTDKSPNVVEIKNKKISEEMKAYFLHLWKVAKR